MWGMTLDTVISATVILANGTIVTASNETNEELFWASTVCYMILPLVYLIASLQAIRGAAPSYGITTSIDFQTYEVPNVATAFQYEWIINSTSEATQALISFQTYVLSPSLPAEIGFDFALLAGPEQGTLTMYLFGAFFGDKDSFEGIIAPFIDTMPSNFAIVNVTEGTWLETLATLALGPFDTSTSPIPIRDTMYAKSLITPMDEPLTEEAIGALMNYLTNDAFGFEGVCLDVADLFLES